MSILGTDQLKKISKWLLLSLAFTPLMVYRDGMFPYIFGKVVFIRLVVTLFLIFFTWYLFRDKGFSRQKMYQLVKNPMVVVATIFLLLATISTLVGVNPYRSFFGNLERGEGLLSLICFWTFFVGAFLLFEQKDWSIFLKATLLVGVTLVADSLFDFIGGGGRPKGSFVGNPSFIAAYLIFVIFSALVVWAWSKNKLWRALSLTTIILAPVGIFITKTRGALIGLVVGLLAVLLYSFWRGKGQTVRLGRRSVSLKTLAGTLLLVCLLFIVVFAFTARQPIWQNVPGLDRLAGLSIGNNASLQTRLLSAESSLASINPGNESWARLALGWGPENFDVAYNLYYNPSYFKYSTVWFDKAHNQVLDVLVTNGSLGLLAYLALWGLAIYGLLKYCSREENNGFFFSVAGIFFVVSYFVQNLALFDQITTYIPVFAFMASAAQMYPAKEIPNEDSENNQWFRFTFLIFAFFMLSMLIWQTLIPTQQTKTLVRALRSGNVQEVSASLDRAARPYTYVQLELRSKLVETLIKSANNDNADELFDQSIALMKESVDRGKYTGARFAEGLGDAYTMRGIYAEGDEYIQYLIMGESYLRLALEQAPGRQMIMTQLARNLVQQSKFDEAEKVMDEMLAFEPDALNARFQYGIIIAPHGGYERSGEALDLLRATMMNPKFSSGGGNAGDIRNTYQSYLIRFYRNKNSEAFLDTMRRAAELEKLIDEVNAWRLEQGKKELSESKTAEIEKNIEIFLRLGWDGVKF